MTGLAADKPPHHCKTCMKALRSVASSLSSRLSQSRDQPLVYASSIVMTLRIRKLDAELVIYCMHYYARYKELAAGEELAHAPYHGNVQRAGSNYLPTGKDRLRLSNSSWMRVESNKGAQIQL
jgi:hypothetical protein